MTTLIRLRDWLQGVELFLLFINDVIKEKLVIIIEVFEITRIILLKIR